MGSSQKGENVGADVEQYDYIGFAENAIYIVQLSQNQKVYIERRSSFLQSD
jgi:hypothetical protein